MKRLGILLLVLCFIALLGLIGLRTIKGKVRTDLSQPISYPSSTPASSPKIEKKGDETSSLFVPYWTLKSAIESDFDEYIYFGIAPNQNSINKNEAGFANIETFVKKTPENAKKSLVIRMTNTNDNLAILKDKRAQEKIAQESLAIAHEYGFDGIILDLEVSAIPFDSLIKQINNFTALFYTQAKKQDMPFSFTIYGDTFYRLRPYEIKTLAQNADRVLIMAYDFHKSKGNPGPNFPLGGIDLYGYTLTKMTDDFLKFVPSEKITVIFGLFGYDWTINDQGKSVGSGVPLTTSEIEAQFINNCSAVSCSFKRDETSSETKITYQDDAGKNHIVWFEDMQSIAAKKKLLEAKGISSYSFWAHSYF